ncbi:MAG: Omp28-related outer membrane protein [Bacteroidales bacterium]|nr:Omp28-related outer membrane protein [Bacteroidales bacterium]
MKLKKILAALLFVPFVFASCENYDEDERLKLIEGGETTDSTPITKEQSELTLLLEEFTAWNCPNCPKGTEVLNTIKDTYGENVVITAIHQGSLAKPKGEMTLDLRTAYGEELGEGIISWPTLWINRDVIPSGRGDWETALADYFATATHYLNISLGSKIDANGNVVVSTEIEALEDISSNLVITLYMTENDIEGKQNDNSNIIDYSFQHVLRDNPIVNYPLTMETLTQGTKLQKSYLLKPAAGVNKSNCHVVVMVADATSGKVLQANEIELK